MKKNLYIAINCFNSMIDTTYFLIFCVPGAQIASQVWGNRLIKFVSKPSSVFFDFFHSHSGKQLIIPELINFFKEFRKKGNDTFAYKAPEN